MSHQRQATARSGGKQSSQRGKSETADHWTRNMILMVVGGVVLLSLLGFGAAIVYDRTSGQTSSITQEEAQATMVGGDSGRAVLVRRYVDEHFADATWHESVMAYEGDGSTIMLETNLADDPFGMSRASKMCDAVSGYIYSEGRSEAKFTSIVIVSVEGKQLVTRPDRDTVCSEVVS